MASRAQSSASREVSVRPPCVVTTKPECVPGARLTSSESTSTWAPKRSAISSISSGRAIAAELTPTLSAPTPSSRATSSDVRTPPPTVSGMKTSSAVRRTTSYVVARSSTVAVTSRKVSSSAPCAKYSPRELHGVAHVAQVLEVDALDDSPSGDVEARDHAADQSHRYSLALWIAVTRIARAPIA